MIRSLFLLSTMLALPANAALVQFGTPEVYAYRGGAQTYDIGEDTLSYSGSADGDGTIDPVYNRYSTAQFRVELAVLEDSFVTMTGTGEPDGGYAWVSVGGVSHERRPWEQILAFSTLDGPTGAFTGSFELPVGTYSIFSSTQAFEGQPTLSYSFDVAPIPEPSSVVLAIVGGLVVAWGWRANGRRRAQVE